VKDNLNVLSAVANSRIKDESVQETEGIDSESMSHSKTWSSECRWERN